MTREHFIKKWLANPQKQYNQHCRDEMRDDLDMVIDWAVKNLPSDEGVTLVPNEGKEKDCAGCHLQEE